MFIEFIEKSVNDDCCERSFYYTYLFKACVFISPRSSMVSIYSSVIVPFVDLNIMFAPNVNIYFI
jgi:hypothetical protein